MMTILVCLLVLYNAWLVTCLLWEKRQGGERSEGDVPAQEKSSGDACEIVGRSLFRMEEAARKVPQAATFSGEEELREEDVTFADETPERHDTARAERMPAARIPDDKLDEAFSDVRMEDVPVEYDGEAPEGTARTGYASGVSFEDIERAVRTAGNPKANEAEEQHAGMVFSRMEGNELFEKLVQSSSAIGKKITGLMERYLNRPAVPRQGTKGAEEPLSPGIPVIPDSVEGFNIRDFV